MIKNFLFTGPSIRITANERIYVIAIGSEVGLVLRPLRKSSGIFGPAVAREKTEVADRKNLCLESRMAPLFELPLLRNARDNICSSM
jgi:hypothetical protein